MIYIKIKDKYIKTESCSPLLEYEELKSCAEYISEYILNYAKYGYMEIGSKEQFCRFDFLNRTNIYCYYYKRWKIEIHYKQKELWPVLIRIL